MDNKRKQHRFIWIAGMAASACLLAACGTSQKGQITVEPSGLLLLPDVSERAEVNASFRIPANYFSKRSRLVITPQLLSADSSVLQEYAPVVLDASVYRKKVERLEVLDGFSDPYAAVAKEVDHTRAFRVPYRAEIQFPEGLKSGSLRAVVSNDGCGECSGVDTLLLASIRNPLSLLRKETKLVALESDFVVRPKVREGKGVANLQFVINRFDINPEMGNNREEMEGMVETLAPVLQDSLSILNNLDITGIASADGSLAFNTELSRNRALSAKRWLVERLDIPAAIERKITVSSRPEGWTPVLEAMRRAGDKDADRVEAILEKYADENDDVQEYHIRRLPCWNRIKDNYLQKDRVVKYRYAYTVKSFTSDAEMLALYRRRPRPRFLHPRRDSALSPAACEHRREGQELFQYRRGGTSGLRGASRRGLAFQPLRLYLILYLARCRYRRRSAGADRPAGYEWRPHDLGLFPRRPTFRLVHHHGLGQPAERKAAGR